MKNYQAIKKELHSSCLSLIEEQIKTNQDILTRLQDSLEQENKSSAGDKFETSRAMLQAEMDRHKTIIIKAKEQKQLLSQVPLTANESIQEGSLVITDKGNYYIAVSLGKIILDDKYFSMSLGSPLGQQLKGQSAGNTVTFNNNAFSIIAVH